MKGLLGRKIGMTQMFDESGKVVPVTIIEAGPCYVTQIKEENNDGYSAVQIGYEVVKEYRLSRPELGHLKKNRISPLRHLVEIRGSIQGVNIGDEIKVNIFKPGEYVDVTGLSKGRGFTGAVKRWGFRGGPKSHGSMIHRKPMSIGDTNAARVIKGKKMPGHYGRCKVTVQNLKVLKVDNDNNCLIIKGAVPGENKGLILIKESVKKRKG